MSVILPCVWNACDLRNVCLEHRRRVIAIHRQGHRLGAFTSPKHKPHYSSLCGSVAPFSLVTETQPMLADLVRSSLPKVEVTWGWMHVRQTKYT